MNDLISIIVPVYNVEQFIRKSLDSILAQTYQNLEIILIDDGSKDSSPQICDEYAQKDSRIKVIHQQNQGVCAARNTALEIATGTYLGFVDPDDWCAPDMFEYLINNASKEQADITCCRYYRVTPGKDTMARCDGVDAVLNKDEAMAELINHFVIRNIFWNKLFTKAVFQNIVFPVGRIYEGTAMIYKLIEKANKVVLLGDPKYYYYKNENSYIHIDTLKHSLDYAIAHIDRYEDLKDQYPNLTGKMFEDMLDGLNSLKNKLKYIDDEERKDNEADIETVEAFFRDNKAALDNAKITLAQKKGKNGKLISIIVPVCNVQRYLRKCLDSILTQTYRNFEVILVDDGSPDNSPEICDEYAAKDARIKVIHQENQGVCAARNAAMRIAKGDYIGFVDPDDWITSDMYAYLVRKLEKYNADIVSCRFYRVEPGKPTVSLCNGIDVTLNKDNAIKELVMDLDIRSYFWNKLFRKEMFEGIEFPEGRIYEGTLCMHKIFEKAKKVVLLGDPKYYYFDNQSSLVNTRTIRNGLDYALAYMERYDDLVKKYPDLKQKLMLDAVTAIRAIRYICRYIKESEIKEYEQDFQKIREFLLKHEAYINSDVITKREQKEVKALSLITPRGFKKAHRAAAINMRKETFNKILKTSKGPKNRKPLPPEMTPEQQEILKKLQATLIEILDEIDRICKKHNLKYYLYGGTLLGAVRSKGIIPWDDDMDIVMIRSDYEKFAKICKTELSDKYFYQTSITDPEFPPLFAKIRKNGTYVRETKWDDKDFHKGIFVDILPLDYFPKNRVMGSLVLHMASFLHQVCAFNNSNSDKTIVHILYTFARIFPKKFWYRVRNIVLKTCNALSGKKYVCSFGSHYQPVQRRVLKTEWFGEGIPMELEGKEYMAPSHWEGYLLHLFGKDYMQLPPPKDRVCHGDLEHIRFGDEQ